MHFTLSRYRLLRPQPPFRLGGEYRRLDERHYLCDPQGWQELSLPKNVAERLQLGDLISVDIERVECDRLIGSDVQLVHASLGREPRALSAEPGKFSRFVNDVRSYFLHTGLNELQTPTLVTCPGLEPTLEAFAVGDQFLPTSPEISLKKALGQGWTDIFEIKSCFRRGEHSKHHAPEFTMLEWYRGFAGLDVIVSDVRGLLEYLSQRQWGEKSAVLETDFKALFTEHLAFQLSPQTSVEELRELCAQQGVEFLSHDSFTDLFHRLMLAVIEPALAALKVPVIVRRFPPSMAALARLDSAGWADRFELYWKGLEIANAFYEVIDPREQEQRWQMEQLERARLGTSPLPTDPELIRALERGLPPTAGIALGVERLFMAFSDTSDIRHLKLF